MGLSFCLSQRQYIIILRKESRSPAAIWISLFYSFSNLYNLSWGKKNISPLYLVQYSHTCPVLLSSYTVLYGQHSLRKFSFPYQVPLTPSTYYPITHNRADTVSDRQAVCNDSLKNSWVYPLSGLLWPPVQQSCGCAGDCLSFIIKTKPWFLRSQ